MFPGFQVSPTLSPIKAPAWRYPFIFPLYYLCIRADRAHESSFGAEKCPYIAFIFPSQFFIFPLYVLCKKHLESSEFSRRASRANFPLYYFVKSEVLALRANFMRISFVFLCKNPKFLPFGPISIRISFVFPNQLPRISRFLQQNQPKSLNFDIQTAKI